MANPSPPPSNRGLANLEKTRQQLQELDSLLQQMLALPAAEANAPAEAPPAPTPKAEPGEQAPKRLQTLAIQRTTPVSGEALSHLKRPMPLLSTPPPASPARPKVETPTAPVVELSPRSAAVQIPVDFDPAAMDLTGPATFDLNRDESLGYAAIPPREWGSGFTKTPVQRPLIYRSLVGLNATFDWTLGMFGPFGRSLTTERGKAWLGWLGIVCLLGAAALAVGLVLGWTW
jgi:hypothetical protein